MAKLTRCYRSLLVLLTILLAAAQLTGQKAKLSSMQLEHLIQIQAPDDLIATQVRTRGVSFAVTSKIIEGFSHKGAGPNTLSALRALDQSTLLEIRSEAGATVSIDGKGAGATGSDGILKIGDLSPGAHSLVLAKDGFHDNRQPITLGPRETRQVSIPLEWAGGLLSINLVPATAEISITGPITFSNAVRNARCPAGSYTASAHREGFVSQTRTFTVAAGEDHHEAFQLAADPAILNKALEDAQKALTAGDLDAATRLSRQAVELDQHSGEGNAILAAATFLRGDLNDFSLHAQQALQAGSSVTVSLMHLHNFPKRTIHRIEMTVSRAGVKFDMSAPSRCKLPQSLNYQQISQISVLQNQGLSSLHFNWVDHPGAMAVHDIDFLPLGSEFVSPQAAPGTIVLFGPKLLQTPSDTANQYQLIIDLIRQARR
jgi:hypothetical protein